MGPRLRKAMLTVHLVASIGWIGAVIAYLALDVVAVTSPDTDAVKASFIAMDLSARYAIVPLAVASLVTGIVMSLGTAWGLFRHYWVVISFVLTVFALAVLLGHVGDIGAMSASGAHDPAGASHAATGLTHGQAGPGVARGDFLHAGGGLVVLLFVTTLNVFKPKGLTPYGWRRLRH